MLPIIDAQELLRIGKERKAGKRTAIVSLDLGLTKTEVMLWEKGFVFGKDRIEIPRFKDDNCCFQLIGGTLQKAQFFSDETRCLYKLIPTKGRPILQISATAMHKKPFVDRIEKDRLVGIVLDAGTGLGYTAIEAAKTATKVITIEIDAMVFHMQEINPYSQALLTAKNIERYEGDITEAIKDYADGFFDSVILDGGTPRSSGEFFSQAHYDQVFRVLKKGGTLYHYVPNHGVKSGRDFGAEVMGRIKKAGFSSVERFEEDSYLIARKGM